MKKFFPLTWFLNFLFPPRCLSCRQEDTWLCLDCLANLPRSRDYNLDSIVAAFPYEEPKIRKAVWLLKYKKIRELAQAFALPLYEAIIEELGEIKTFSPDKKKILLIPVPLSSHKLRKRGFNQAEELATALASLNPALFQLENKILVKTRDTATQVSLKNRQERLANLRGAFALKQKSKVKGKTVLVLDDVATTGATIGEIRRVLLKSGAKKVKGLVIAHGR